MWPESKTCAAVISFDFDAEEVWIGENPENAQRPGTLSQGTYGAKVAVPAVLAMLERLDITASFFIPGRVAERHPTQVAQIIAAGHEVGHHGYTHTSPTKLGAEAEETELIKGLEILNALGATVRGYRSPAWDFSPYTLDLLVKHGFTYSSNLMDDIKPYRHPGHNIIELPVHWTLDDAPHFWFDSASWNKTIRTSAEVRSLWTEEFGGIRRMRGLFMLTMHPQIIGRPGRLLMLEDFLGWVKSHSDVWIATAGEVAAIVE
jgi:peptidoglycan/xylan/chitin deacetylase (PgdA/CDA1 family)